MDQNGAHVHLRKQNRRLEDDQPVDDSGFEDRCAAVTMQISAEDEFDHIERFDRGHLSTRTGMLICVDIFHRVVLLVLWVGLFPVVVGDVLALVGVSWLLWWF